MMVHFEPLVHFGKLLDGLELGTALLFRADGGGHILAWDNLNAEILRLWREHILPDEDGALAPLFYPDRPPSELLFVGLNPSFNIAETQARAPADIDDVGEFYMWQNFAEDRMQPMRDIQHRFVEGPQILYYFVPMRNIAEDIGMRWTHVDLYPLRRTNQHETVAYFRNRHDLRENLERLFRETICILRPKIIVVANAFAARRFRHLFANDLRFDEQVGYHRLSMDSKPAVFFSSMLTGQRALDAGSLERLRWHIRRAAGL